MVAALQAALQRAQLTQAQLEGNAARTADNLNDALAAIDKLQVRVVLFAPGGEGEMGRAAHCGHNLNGALVSIQKLSVRLEGVATGESVLAPVWSAEHLDSCNRHVVMPL